jgi:hypothetical protein
MQDSILMKDRIKFDAITLNQFVNLCYDLIQSVSSKKEALNIIASEATREFGPYFGPVILQSPDEISVNFIELLDQIVFEMDENRNNGDNIHEYMADDLYLRITIYLEAMKDISLYLNSLMNRILCADDMIIIRHYRMREYMPLLLKEFSEQPNMQKHIIKCMLTFESDDLLNFYYQIVHGSYCMEIKALALIGLKSMNTAFTSWDRLKNSDDELLSLISYAEGFDPRNLEKNALPYEINSLFFVINFIELKHESISFRRVRNWMLNVFKTFLFINISASSSLYSSIYRSISNILMRMDNDVLKSFMNNDDDLAAFVSFIDLFPRAIFDRITVKLDLMDREFVHSVNDLISSGKVNVDEVNSNIQSYLVWNTTQRL